MLKIHDEGCLKGYWKSTIKMENDQPWKWRDHSFERILLEEIFGILQEKTAAPHSSIIFGEGADEFNEVFSAVNDSSPKLPNEWRQALETIQKFPITRHHDVETLGNALASIKIFTSVFDALLVLCTAFNNSEKNICRIPVRLAVDGLEFNRVLTFYDTNDPNDERFELGQFKKIRSHVFQKHNVDLSIGTPKLYATPVREKLLKTMKDIGVNLPLAKDPTFNKALKHAMNGDFRQACQNFQLVEDKSAHVLNNIGFCKIILGETEEARPLIEEALKKELHPLFYNNLAVISFCAPNLESATQQLAHAWDLMATEKRWSEKAISMLVITSADGSFQRLDNLPLSVGLGLSRCSLSVQDFNFVDEFLRAKLSQVDVDLWVKLLKLHSEQLDLSVS